MAPAAHFDPERLRAANINPSTGLATDYLNHYNEIAMMIASLEGAPEMCGEVLDWRPVGYPTHFRMTGFKEHDLAIAAYESITPSVKARFLAARRDLELAIMDVQERIEAHPEAAAQLASSAPRIFDAIARLGGVINGGTGEASVAQADVDSLFS